MGNSGGRGDVVNLQQFHQGDIVKMNFDPASGHEQRGFRPAVIISNDTLNQHSRLLMVCPITNTIKGHPFHVLLDDRTQTTGTVLCDQVRSLAVSSRNAVKVEEMPQLLMEEILSIIRQFL